jgi:hypothetical protein
MSKTAKKTPALPASPEFSNAVDLLAIFSDASNRLDELQAEANGELLELLDDKKPEYAKWQELLAKAEAALEVLTLKHPEWFSANRRSIKTPYGTIKLHSSSKLEVKNEELTIALIEHEAEEQASLAIATDGYKPPFDAASLLRTRKELNLEALEQLDEAALKQFRVKRLTKDNFSVVPAKLDMGKAVADAAQEEKKAA